MEKFKIKKSDTRPPLNVQLLYNNGSAVDLSSSTVYFNMGALIDRSAYTSGACVITGSTTGNCNYNWSTSDTDTVGDYWGEFEVNWGNGSIMTLPNNDNLKIQIYEDYN